MTFEEWKLDLVARAEDHVANHPEPPPPSKPPVPEPLRQAKEYSRLRIYESVAFPGVWSVYADNNMIETFYGLGAYTKALHLLMELINSHGL